MTRNNQGLFAKVLMLAVGAFMLLSVSAVTVSAQDQNRDWQHRNGDWRQEEQRREEIRRREEYRERREAERQGRYTNNGYYGNNGYYNNGYRNNRSYNNGYRNNGSYNNGYAYNNNFTQTALNAGYNEGVKEGRRDRGRGYSDLRNSGAYRNADQDYNSRLGDRNTYQQYYRQGFENGYRDGLRGY